MGPLQRILIRFNTKHAEDYERVVGRKWRVLVNGTERLAEKVIIRARDETIEEEVDGIPKFHVEYYGFVRWNGDIATIEDRK